MAIQINTASVMQAADNISAENQALRNSYEEIDKAISVLKTSWNGTASDMCSQRANNIKTVFKDTRYAVIDSFVRFMRAQVSENYETTETVISNVADAFK